MKNIFLKIGMWVVLLGSTCGSLYSYVFTFKNYTDEAVEVAVKLSGAFEPLYPTRLAPYKDGVASLKARSGLLRSKVH